MKEENTNTSDDKPLLVITRVWKSKHTKQKSVTIPSRCDIDEGDHVMITKIKEELNEGSSESSDTLKLRLKQLQKEVKN